MASAKAIDNQTLEHFQCEVGADGVYTVLIDLAESKVNTLSTKIKNDLEFILNRASHDPAIKAVVIGSNKKNTFVAGADIEVLRDVGSAKEATQLAHDMQQAFFQLENLHRTLHKPVVAAIDGACMGGGLELALACSHRIASDSHHTLLALPEVKLGVFPGAGGTQRLPRLIGLSAALDMILTGKNVRPKKALKLGLVDDVVEPGHLLKIAQQKAAAWAKEAPEKESRLTYSRLGFAERITKQVLDHNFIGQHIVFQKARQKVLKQSHGNYPAPLRALEVIRIGLQDGPSKGYAAEAKEFGRLAVSDEARALMSIFFATQTLKKDKGHAHPDTHAKVVGKVGVLGAGLMGAGIATVSIAKAKLPVRLKDIDEASITRGYDYVYAQLKKRNKQIKGRPFDLKRSLQHLTTTVDSQGLAGVDVIIEAVFEDLALKQKVLKECEEIAHPECIFASNTSSLPITDIAKASKRPETVIGMHYFSPVEKMPLLEIITTSKTADWVTATCVELGKKQGKTVIVVRDGTGFYTSRILAPYMNEAAWLLHEQGAIEQVDQAMQQWGFPVGPLTLLDEVGIDVGHKVAGIMQAKFGDRIKPPASMELLHKDGRQGRKSGRGVYRYSNGVKDGVDHSAYTIIGQDKTRKHFANKVIQERLALQMVNEAVFCLEEDILRSPRDGDIGAVFGLGFPPFRGGPFFFIDHMGADWVVQRLEHYAQTCGDRFRPAAMLTDYAKQNKKFRLD
jgi:3-hydroxyacyl-CoA dehydrogenase / enoyl-CoA hydratase / 3-hydroxybutyryl-CoA epimerase